MAAWNWLDWTLAAVVFGSVAAAVLKGFIRELISLAALFAGLVIAALGYRAAAGWFEDLTRSHELALGAGFLTLFLGTLLLGALASSLARKLIKTAGLQFFDHFLGGVFGLIRGVAIDCVLLLALIAFAIKPEAVRQSMLAPYVATGARAVASAMPADLKSEFRSGLEKFRQALLDRDKKAKQN